MATHHSKTGRAKGSNDKIVVPSWDDVWNSLKKEKVITSVEKMNCDGWKTLQQAAEEMRMSRVHINHMANDGKFDTCKAKVFYNGKTREIVFIRPII